MMNAPGYGSLAAASFSQKDQSDLNTLAICHYAYAALLALAGMIPLGVVFLGFGFASALVPTLSHSASGSAAAGGAASGLFVSGVFLAIFGVVALLVWAKAALVVYSGMSLKRGRHRLLSQVVACLCCLNMPLGTLLGVFTLVVLEKPGVRTGYLANSSQ